jgi:hypothetical protein
MVVATLIATLAVGLPKPATENVIFVMTDGLRWQEVFSGADATLMEPIKSEPFKKRFWRDSENERRQILMPFTWGAIATQGQIYGNRRAGSDSFVTNGHNFSYPGYNETLTGAPDPRVNSNSPKPNENVTVLEWLHRQRGFEGRVAAFASWTTLSAIINRDRCGFPVNVGFEPFLGLRGNQIIEGINKVKSEIPRTWGEVEAYDTLTFNTAFEYMKAKKPKVLYIELIETDAWGHGNKYDQYLDAAARVDSYLKKLWDYAQSTREYRGKTTLVVTCDHGRGEGKQWTSHGASIPDTKYTWMMFLGPDTKPLGERKGTAPVTNGMVATTIARLLGLEYSSFQPKAASAIADVLN